MNTSLMALKYIKEELSKKYSYNYKLNFISYESYNNFDKYLYDWYNYWNFELLEPLPLYYICAELEYNCLWSAKLICIEPNTNIIYIWGVESFLDKNSNTFYQSQNKVHHNMDYIIYITTNKDLIIKKLKIMNLL